MVSTLRESIEYLRSIGFINVVLPFLFVYIILFAILEKTKIFGLENGKTRKNINSMIAFSISFIFIASMSRVESLITYLQFIGMFLVVVMMMLYFLAAFKYDFNETISKNLIYVLVLIMVVIAFLYSMGIMNFKDYGFILDLITNPVILTVICFIVIVWFIVGGESASVPVKKSKRKSKSGFDKAHSDTAKELEEHGAKKIVEN